ncbi:hypothetical protein C0989_009023 [Termitomyces sp. Mn162]|nr:hypothetical protein C0989_009023 [Termitomyces sp. Mn162]
MAHFHSTSELIELTVTPLQTPDPSMEDDGFSITDTPIESVSLSDYEKQLASLQTYLDSVPYATESVDEMHRKLEEIVGKIYIAAKTQNWLVLSTWDGLLQCWLLMRYPMPKSTRAKLVRLYYELSLIPGVEPRVIRSWTDMLSRLLANKPGSKRKLESTDLELPWKPLWRALTKELWPKKRIQDVNRNVVNILLYVAEQCKRYFPAREILEMLDTFLPLLTEDTVLSVVPVMTSFLPPTHMHLYIPALFKIWEAFNSSVIDDRILELAGLLSEEHISGNSIDAGDKGDTQWKDVGIWTHAEWQVLIGKGLNSMNIPVGTQGASTTAGHADTLSDKDSLRIKKNINRFSAFAKVIVYSMAVDGEIRSDVNQKGYVAGSRALDSLDRVITSTESFFHPSNTGQWTSTLTAFLNRLAAEFIKRVKEEQQELCRTPVTRRLTPAIRKSFVAILRTPALLAMFSKDRTSASYAQSSLRVMAILEPGMVMPELLERAYGGLEIVNETHRTTAVLNMLAGVALPLVSESIDLNDPSKTMCTTMFIVSVVQHIKLGDLTRFPSGISYSHDTDVIMENEYDIGQGVDTAIPALSQEETRSLVRDTTASFADWVTSLVRRILALYENLPEEGGRRNTTGGKQEEGVLKSIKAMMDVVCLHLSDELFDLVLNLLYDYATTNAKSNAVAAFGQLIACMARVKPDKTMSKFLPHCILQIEEEIKHGASSVRTTSSHAALPSDTTLHWNKTKSERGYTSTGRLIMRTLHTLAETYPTNSRFVNADVWDDPVFNKDHNIHWGRLYNPEDVVIEWHVPNDDEVAFVLEILDHVFLPAIDKVENLLKTTSRWDNVDRNDFCRQVAMFSYVYEQPKETVNPCLNDTELAEMIAVPLDMKAGFTLTDASDPRYQKAAAYRLRYGDVCQRAAFALRQKIGSEDHIDAVTGVARAIDTFMLGYGLNRSDLDSLVKNYDQARDANRFWNKQRENSRLVFLKRAQVYHSGRVYMHSLYRRRSALDDKLLEELVELSLSPYTRVRRLAQHVLDNVCGYYVRSTRFILPSIFDALGKGSDPDRMKGALYVLWNKGTEEAVHTDAYSLATPGVEAALEDLIAEFSSNLVDQQLLKAAVDKTLIRVSRRGEIYDNTVSSILAVATQSTTHWRYVEMAARFLLLLLRRDAVTPPEVVKFFMEQCLSPQPPIRHIAQRAMIKVLTFMKLRSYSMSREALWLDEWRNPLAQDVEITNPENFMLGFDESLEFTGGLYVDKIRTGFLAWTSVIKAYRAVEDSSGIQFEPESQPCLTVIRSIISNPDYYSKLLLLWSQESGKSGGTIELRKENILFIKSLVKVLEQDGLENLLVNIDSSFNDSDKFKQRASAEVLSGILRGSKHWPKTLLNNLWTWTMPRLDRIFGQIKPDTITFWETFFYVKYFFSLFLGSAL